MMQGRVFSARESRQTSFIDLPHLKRRRLRLAVFNRWRRAEIERAGQFMMSGSLSDLRKIGCKMT